MALSQLCYNLALFPEESRQTMLSEMQRSLKMDDEEFGEFRRKFIDPMVQRHHAMFPGLLDRRCVRPARNAARRRGSMR